MLYSHNWRRIQNWRLASKYFIVCPGPFQCSFQFPIQFSSAFPCSCLLHVTCFAAFSKPKWFHSLLFTKPKFENTRSIAVELNGTWSSFSGVLIRGGDTLHLQFDTEVHHTTGDIWSTHVDDRSETGNGSEPAVIAHRSSITSRCSRWSFRSSCRAASSSASDKCFPCILDVANLRGSGYQCLLPWNAS